MTIVPYAYYNPDHITKTSKAKRVADQDAIKFLEDKMLEIFKSLKKIADDDDVPSHVKEDLSMVTCFANPWSLDGDKIDEIDKICLYGYAEDKDDGITAKDIKIVPAKKSADAKAVIDKFKGK